MEVRIISAGDEVPQNLENNPRVVKVNLPDSERSFQTGNGEGVWAYIRNADDLEKYHGGIGSFEVILLNHSVYYMGLLVWGQVILVDGRGPDNRPVLNRAWLDELLQQQLTGGNNECNSNQVQH